MNRKTVVVRFGKNYVKYRSIRAAVEELAKIAGVLYSYPEKSGRIHLIELAHRIPSVTSYRVYGGSK